MINLFFVIPTFKRGGVERVTLNIINGLDFSKFRVYLIITCKSENYLLNFLNEEVNVIQLDFPSFRKSFLTVNKLLAYYKADIVFTSFNHLSLGVLLAKFCCFHKYKTVVRLNSLPSNKLQTNFRGKIYNMFFSKVLSRANIIVSQSREMTDDVRSFYDLNSSEIQTISNPVDNKQILELAQAPSPITFDEKYYNLVAIGSLSEVKGFDLLIEALGALSVDELSSMRLYIIGDNREPHIDYQSVLSKLILKNNLSNNVFLLGFHSNPYPILKQADAFVLSSRKEGFPNVVLEALVLSKVCLVTDCVDLSEFIKSNNGVVVGKNSISELIKGLRSIKTKNGTSVTFKNYDFNRFFEDIYQK